MAEEIWYWIIWEERKDPENVIDYNINSEQTKDAFAEINANNQTTTGMANVIPWINAPKLLAKTSIIWWWGWWGWWFNARVIYITTSPTVDDAQTILDSYLEWYWTIVVQNISDAAYRYFYQWYMHYNHLVFVFNWEQWGRMEMRINYSWTTATWIIVS
jgi:hypothetical protein